MAIKQQHMQKIQDYGLTEYEARAYLALLELGGGTAREVASLSRVPRTKIYQVLDDLHSKQLAEMIPERPKKYLAVPFEEYLARFESDYKERLERIAEDRKLAREELIPSTGHEQTSTGTFQVFKGRKNVTTKVEEMLIGAEEEVFHIGTAAAAKRFQYHTPVLAELVEKGVDIRVMVPCDGTNESALEELSESCTITDRPNEGAGAAILVVDNKTALVWHPVPDDGHVFQGDDIAMWTDDEVVVCDLKAGFETTWSEAEER
ncbi:MAG: helix-turn-helix domain-containing protein [Candidatus Thermoplasmatota archaeon]|nr:helix-turn-helix domain-containing protein [Candidatus Thermoplasmatota archaeon]